MSAKSIMIAVASFILSTASIAGEHQHAHEASAAASNRSGPGKTPPKTWHRLGYDVRFPQTPKAGR